MEVGELREHRLRPPRQVPIRKATVVEVSSNERRLFVKLNRMRWDRLDADQRRAQLATLNAPAECPECDRVVTGIGNMRSHRRARHGVES